jgi:putative membrane protein
MHFYEGYHYGGMHFIWWIIWVILMIWIFATPYHIPGQRSRKDTPLDILKKQFVTGQINEEEYQKKKKLIES